MLVRVVVGIVAALFAIGLLTLIGNGYGAFVSIVVALFSSICVYEIMDVSKCKNKALTVVNMVFAACLPLYIGFDLGRFIPVSAGITAAIYIFIVMIMMLASYEKTKFENVTNGLYASIIIPAALSTLMLTIQYMEGMPELFTRSNIIFVLLTAMYCAWLSDTFALFTGMALGKHKLAPNISPKKTVEGAVGGVVFTTISSLITWFIFHKWFFRLDTIKWWMVLVFVPIICVMGMCGDLCASVLKRNYGVKDYGTMFPGHGGAMDRIDSFIFTMPSAYVILRLVTEICAA